MPSISHGHQTKHDLFSLRSLNRDNVVFMVTALLIRALVTVFRLITERAILTSHMMESI